MTSNFAFITYFKLYLFVFFFVCVYEYECHSGSVQVRGQPMEVYPLSTLRSWGLNSGWQQVP